ncbi:MAG: folate family ECF transporter S component [Erysipelotrichaceae bacterium]|nr:folate family ECF transporter S component [Erysipelotrichaceae bacterium]
MLYQVFALLALLLIGFVIFKTHPWHLSPYAIAVTALMAVLSAVLDLLSLRVPFFGFPSLQIGFSQLPLLLLGGLLGPCWAFVGGLIQDLLTLLMNPSTPFLGYTLNKVVIGLVPALWLAGSKGKTEILYRVTYVLLGLIYTVALIVLWGSQSIVSQGTSFLVETGVKIGVTLALAAISFVLILSIFQIRKRFEKEEHALVLVKWILAVITVEVLVQWGLTPLWNYAMYEIPVLASIAIRLVKAGVMVPVTIILCYLSYLKLMPLLNRNTPAPMNKETTK